MRKLRHEDDLSRQMHATDSRENSKSRVQELVECQSKIEAAQMTGKCFQPFDDIVKLGGCLV